MKSTWKIILLSLVLIAAMLLAVSCTEPEEDNGRKVVVEDFKTDYLVGDEFDETKGRIIITEADGSSRIFRPSNDAVTISGFSSSVAKDGIVVSVRCQLGDETVEESFTVNVHPIDEVSFHSPSKITYDSHYTEDVDVSGGYFILRGMGGKLERTEQITASMVSGFDVSAATKENSPYSQKLTVRYGGKDYTYDILITYTDISYFADNAALFDTVNWEGETEPVIDKTLGELALELMRGYVKMAAPEKALIDESLAFDVARTAMMYGFEVWAESIREFRGVFAIELGDLVLYLDDYKTVEAALPLFDDEDSPIYTMAPLLLDIMEIYGDAVVYENETTRIYFDSYPVLSESSIMVLEDMMNHVLDLYDIIETIPEDWSAENIESYSEPINQILSKIVIEKYASVFPDIYYRVSKWRDSDDLFDILYTYLYKNDLKKEMIALSPSGLPTAIKELYDYISSAIVAMNRIGNPLAPTDTSELFYNYLKAEELGAALAARDGEMEGYVYDSLVLNGIFPTFTSEVYFGDMLDYIRISACGYYDLSAGLLGKDGYSALMTKYVAVLDKLVKLEGYEETPDYRADVKALFDGFVALSPAEQYSFLSSLHSLYAMGIPALAFDDSAEDGRYCSLFVTVINKFMRSRLTEANGEAYNNLILAIEVYANRFGYPEWESDFISRMNAVGTAYAAMSGDDLAFFDSYLKGAYDKYAAIKANVEADLAANLGDWQDEFDAMQAALSDAMVAYHYGIGGYFFAAFERVSELAGAVLGSGNADVIYAYYHIPLFEANYTREDGGVTKEYVTFDYMISGYRNYYIDMLTFFGASGYCIYDSYLERDMADFMSLYYELADVYFKRNEENAPEYDKARVLEVIAAYRELSSESKSFFELIDGNMYANALSHFLDTEYSGNAKALAVKLFTLERSYFTYEISPTTALYNSIASLLGEIKGDHLGLGSDAAAFADFEETYNYYVAKCEELLAA